MFDAGGDDADQQERVDHLLAGHRQRPGRDQVLELGEGDVRAPEGDRADDRGEEDRDQGCRAGCRRRARSRGGSPTRRSAPRRRRRRRCRGRPSAASRSSARGPRRRRRSPSRRPRPTTIRPQLPIPSSSRVVTTATAMPTGGDQVAPLGGGRVGALFDPDDEEREGDDVERRGGVAARLEHGDEDASREPVPSRPASAFGFRLFARTCRASGR